MIEPGMPISHTAHTESKETFTGVSSSPSSSSSALSCGLQLLQQQQQLLPALSFCLGLPSTSRWSDPPGFLLWKQKRPPSLPAKNPSPSSTISITLPLSLKGRCRRTVTVFMSSALLLTHTYPAPLSLSPSLNLLPHSSPHHQLSK